MDAKEWQSLIDRKARWAAIMSSPESLDKRFADEDPVKVMDDIWGGVEVMLNDVDGYFSSLDAGNDEYLGDLKENYAVEEEVISSHVDKLRDARTVFESGNVPDLLHVAREATAITVNLGGWSRVVKAMRRMGYEN